MAVKRHGTRNKSNTAGKRATHRNAISIFLSDALGLGLALLERMLVLELAAHGCGWAG